MSEILNIPPHWDVKSLYELCHNIIGGGTPSTKNEEYWQGNIPWITSADIFDIRDIRIRKRITQQAINESATNLLPKGNLIVVTRVGLGKIAIAPHDICFSQDCQGLILKEEIIDKNYALLFLSTAVNLFKWQGRGTTISGVTKKQLANVKLPYPPLSEQRAIVAKIEELLSDLENGKQQLLKAQEQLKVYRQSLLKAAFEGKLTGQNCDSCDFDDLYDSQNTASSSDNHINHMNLSPNHSADTLPEGWKWVTISDIATVGTGATPLKGKKEYYENGNIAWVTSGALNNEYVKSATEFVTETALNETNLTIYPKHTLLLAMYGEGKTRGKCSELLIEAATNQAIAAIHFEKQNVDLKPFVKYFLLKNYNDIRRMSSGGVQPNLNLSIVKKTKLPLPPLEEQTRIVEILDAKLTVCDKIEETITQSLAQAETLKQSILKKAFKGKLI